MKKFMLLSYGFEKPTPEIMRAWGKGFESIADKMADSGRFVGAREISKSGTATPSSTPKVSMLRRRSRERIRTLQASESTKS